MNRRQFLISSGATTSLLFAGCVNPPNKPSTNTNRPRVGKLSVNLPDGVTAYPDLKKTENHTKQPLTLSFTLENTSETDYYYGAARTAKLVGATDRQFGLYPISAYSEPSTHQYDEESDVWVAKSPFIQTEEYRIDDLETNASETQVLVLLQQYYDGEQELSPYPNELRFKSEFRMATSQEGVIDDPIECSVSFSVFPPTTESSEY